MTRNLAQGTVTYGATCAMSRFTATSQYCHQVHGGSSLKHRRVLRAPICSECHHGEGFKNVARYSVQSSLCEY